ncbi:hypothetical protein [Paracoccus xiamenensis]|uniref:hypothetical protein n=1 Tax=Paracoccus xiamenensis TaxID=2714901 RepID=UPI001408F934|nr:hypothetical protein [Paracoccus xiamenensis]NHF73297.1 hypothetical protein [Paracoccus xiamenensis]
MAQENPLAHSLGAGARAVDPDFLNWNLPDGDVGPWLHHAPLLFTLLHQLEPANVLAICEADSALPQLLRALPNTLDDRTPVATIQLDPATAEDDAEPDSEVQADSEGQANRLKAELENLPDNIFNLILIDLPLTAPLITVIQGEPLARVSSQGAIMGLHGGDRTPEGKQLAVNIRLTQPHLTIADGVGLVVFPTADDIQPLQAANSQLGMLRSLGRAYSLIGAERRKNQADTDNHKEMLASSRKRQTQLEDTNKKQTERLLEQSAKLSDANRAINALPAQLDTATVQSARARIEKLGDKAAGGIDVPATVIRLLDAIDALRGQTDQATAERDETVKEAQAVIAQLRIKEAELLKSSHAVGRMTQELAGLALVVESSTSDMAELRSIAARKVELETENRKLQTQLAEAGTRQRKLEKQVNDFANSTSWRISAPIRAVGKILRRR